MLKLYKGDRAASLIERCTQSGVRYFSGKCCDDRVLLMDSGDSVDGLPVWHLVVFLKSETSPEVLYSIDRGVFPFNDFIPGAILGVCHERIAKR